MQRCRHGRPTFVQPIPSPSSDPARGESDEQMYLFQSADWSSRAERDEDWDQSKMSWTHFFSVRCWSGQLFGRLVVRLLHRHDDWISTQRSSSRLLLLLYVRSLCLTITVCDCHHYLYHDYYIIVSNFIATIVNDCDLFSYWWRTLESMVVRVKCWRTTSTRNRAKCASVKLSNASYVAFTATITYYRCRHRNSGWTDLWALKLAERKIERWRERDTLRLINWIGRGSKKNVLLRFRFLSMCLCMYWAIIELVALFLSRAHDAPYVSVSREISRPWVRLRLFWTAKPFSIQSWKDEIQIIGSPYFFALYCGTS